MQTYLIVTRHDDYLFLYLARAETKQAAAQVLENSGTLFLDEYITEVIAVDTDSLEGTNLTYTGQIQPDQEKAAWSPPPEDPSPGLDPTDVGF